MKAGKYSGRVYRYATAPAINIAGKVDGEGRVGGSGGGDPEPGIYNETKKGYSVFLRRRFPPPSSPSLAPLIPQRWFLFPSRCTPLDSGLSSKFTLYRRSTKPPGPSGALLKIEDAIHLAGGPAGLSRLNKGNRLNGRARFLPRTIRR